MDLFYIRNLLIGSLNCSRYKEGQLIAECPSTQYPNTDKDYELELEQDGIYELHLVGAGGGGLHSAVGDGVSTYNGSGASGAALIGEIKLTTGIYTFKAGAAGRGNASTSGGSAGGLSEFKNNSYYAKTTGGTGGWLKYNPFTGLASWGGGTGGTVSYTFDDLTEILCKSGKNGNKGGQWNDVAGAKSVYDDTSDGKGAGGMVHGYIYTPPENGKPGYFKLIYKRRK